MKFLQIFQDPQGKYSQARVRGFMAATLGMVILSVGAFSAGVTFGDAMGPAIILFGYSFGEKAFQNITEMQVSKDKNK